MKIQNTKETAIEIKDIKEWTNQAKYGTFICCKCGKKDTKRDVSLNKMTELICGPCLRKEGTLKAHGTTIWNNSDKAKQTCLQRYGVDNASKSFIVKTKISQANKVSMKNSEVIKKRKITCKEKYNEENFNNSTKREQTNLLKYGTKTPGENEQIKEKQRITLQQKYPNFKNMPGPLASHKKFLEYRIEQIPELDFIDTNNFHGKYDENGLIYYEFTCKKCGEKFKDSFHDGLPICRKCNPKSYHLQEYELGDYIKSIYFDKIILHDRKILNGKELDIFLPKLKLAFEYNGSYWHSYNRSFPIPLKQFMKETEWKRVECQKLGIKLINIDECDWLDKKDVIKRFIQDQVLPRQRIFARNCEVKLIDTNEARTFCDYYHFNGYRGGEYKYGLYHNNELLIVAVFGKHKNDYECMRLCYKTGYDIIGGWAKICKHFGKKFLHYVNLKYFSGDNKTGCGYRILVGKERKILHRQSLWKKTNLLHYCKNYDENLSDFQNCIQNNLLIIVDQGNDIRWYNSN